MAGTRAQSCDRCGSGTLHPGKFLEVVCDCFPPPLDVPTFAARCLYVRNDARDPISERWNCGRERFRSFCLNSDFHLNLGIFYCRKSMIWDRRQACSGFFRPKNPTASAGIEPANLGTKGQHATPRPPKPLTYIYIYVRYNTTN